MMSVKNVLIIGGGIAGLTAAVALRRADYEVDVIEINPHWPVSGIGITLPGNALRALDTIGLAGKCVDAGYPINAFRFHDDQGKFIGETPQIKIADPKYPASCGITRPRFHAILQDAVCESGTTIGLGLSVATIEQTDEKAMVTFSDGTSGQYDLVIGSDGYRSALRNLVFGSEYQTLYSGQVGWRCTVPRPAEVTDIWLFNGEEFKTGFIPLAPDIMYIYMTETPPPGPPPRYAEEHLVEAYRERLASFGGPVAKVRDRNLNATSHVVYRPFEVLLMPTPWYRGRVVLIGDAAHSMTPHVVQGGATAIEDAIVLAEELTTQAPLPDVLNRFMQRRYRRDKAMFDISLQIGKWEQDHDPHADSAGLIGKSVMVASEPI